jgi:hypothetical protein
MRNLSTWKVIAALTVLVVLLSIALNRSKKRAERASLLTNDVSVASSSAISSKQKHFYQPRPAAETPEQMGNELSDELSELAKLPREKVEEYLARNKRNAESLLAAFHALNDTNYLREVATNFPNDPQLQWTILSRNAFPEERRKWLDLFKVSSPSNPLANYLSATDYFKSGQTNDAISELLESSKKSQFKDYTIETLMDGEELSLSAGETSRLSTTRGMNAMAEDFLPTLAGIKGLAQNMAQLRSQYVTAGDSDSADHISEIGISLARQLESGDGSKMLIAQLVGIATEAMTLRALDQNKAYDFLGGKTPAQRSEELKQQKASFVALTKGFSDAYANMNEAEMMNYSARVKTFGEVEAMRWMQQRHGNDSTTPSR